MAGETIYLKSAWADLQAAASVADGVVSGGATTSIDAAFSATEADYPLLDLKVTVSVGTPVANGTVEIFLQGDGDTTSAPAPTATFQNIYVGTVQLNPAAPTQHFYLFDVPNWNSEGSLYMLNNSGATLTIALRGRAKTQQPAP